MRHLYTLGHTNHIHTTHLPIQLSIKFSTSLIKFAEEKLNISFTFIRHKIKLNSLEQLYTQTATTKSVLELHFQFSYCFNYLFLILKLSTYESRIFSLFNFDKYKSFSQFSFLLLAKQGKRVQASVKINNLIVVQTISFLLSK